MGENVNNRFPGLINQVDVVQIDLDKIMQQAKKSQSELNKLEIASKGVGDSFNDAANKMCIRDRN